MEHDLTEELKKASKKLSEVNKSIAIKKKIRAEMTKAISEERKRLRAQGVFLQEVRDFEKARNVIHKAGEVIGHFIRILDQASDEALLKSVRHIQSRFAK